GGKGPVHGLRGIRGRGWWRVGGRGVLRARRERGCGQDEQQQRGTDNGRQAGKRPAANRFLSGLGTRRELTILGYSRRSHNRLSPHHVHAGASRGRNDSARSRSARGTSESDGGESLRPSIALAGST